MRWAGVALAVSLMTWAGVCTTSAGELPGIHKLSPAERANCLSKGGKVNMAGLSMNEMCEIPFADAGKVCRGSKDCLGACWLDQKQWPSDVGPNTKVVGKCQPTNFPYGCYTTVENGHIQEGICVD